MRSAICARSRIAIVAPIHLRGIMDWGTPRWPTAKKHYCNRVLVDMQAPGRRDGGQR